MDFEKLKQSLIEKGADSKIFEMPAIRERLEKIVNCDIFVNSDGTIDFDGYHMERDEEKNKFSLEKVENSQKDVHYSMDDFVGDPNGYTLYKTKATKISINEYGIEDKLQVKEAEDVMKAKWENIKFDNIESPVKYQIDRINGRLEEHDLEANRYFECLDSGSWSMDMCSNELLTSKLSDGEKKEEVRYTITNFEKNMSEYVKKYPNLEEYYEKRKEELLDCIDAKYNKINDENNTLRDNNEKLQKMLKKSLGFAEKVRNSVVGKIFFGKSANEVLGDSNKDVKLLDDGEER